MFGWLQLGRRYDLTLKASRCCRILRHGRRQHLDRHDPLHAAMLGLEHLPHAAGPDLVEDRVVAEDQRLGSALIIAGPGTSSDGCFDQFLSEFFERPWDEPSAERSSRACRQQRSRVVKLLDELSRATAISILDRMK